jgi:putative transposase
LHVRRLNRRWGEVRVPKVGWVRFRWTRAVPDCRSYRITLDHSKQKGSPEQQAERARIARLRAREADRRKDWCEKVSTGLARRFDVIRFEDLRIKTMTRSAGGTAENPGRNVAAKSGLNRAILAQGWGLLVRRTQDKAPGRVEMVRAAYTSPRCSACGWISKDSRNSQAGFCCIACGFTCNADINASINVAAGHAGGTPASVREPQLLTSLAGLCCG